MLLKLQWGQEFFTPGIGQEYWIQVGPGISFNGARSFLLLECQASAFEPSILKPLQWGQEFFTPGMESMMRGNHLTPELQWGQEFFTPGIG